MILSRHVSFGPVKVFTPRTAAAAAATGWWSVSGKTCVAAYQAKDVASYAASLSNLQNPGTYDLTEGTAPSWDTATGWTFNGSTHNLRTGITPGQDQSWSMLARFANATRGVVCTIVGQQGFTAANSFSLDLRFANEMQYRNGATLITSSTANSGVMAIAGSGAYLNGSSAGTISAGAVDTIRTLYVGAQNVDNSPTRFYTGDILAIAIYSDTLTSGELSTVSSAMVAL